VDYMYIAQATIIIYDYALTLHREVKFIWFSPWTYTKVLFLLIRYLSFVCLFMVVYTQTVPGISAAVCRVTRPMQGWFIFLLIVSAESVLSIRTWAVWNTNMFVGAILLALTVGHIVANSIFNNALLTSMEIFPSPYPEFRGCFVTKIDQVLWKQFAVATVVDFCVLALMAISAFQTYRLSNDSELLCTVHRDGVLFYVYLLCVAIATLVTSIVLPLDLFFLLTPLQISMYSVFTTRIVLNIKEAGSERGLFSDLHTRFDDESSMQWVSQGGRYPELESLQPGSIPLRSMSAIARHSTDDASERLVWES